MPRPRNPIGTFGTISATKLPNGRYEALTRFRDQDGASRRIKATADTKAAAIRELKRRMTVRDETFTPEGELSPHAPFPRLAEAWLAQLDAAEGLEERTKETYRESMRLYILPAFEHLSIREVSVKRCDDLLLKLLKESWSKAKKAKVVLSLTLGLAVRYEVIRRNPITGCSRLKRPPHVPDAFSDEEVAMIRHLVRAWRRGPGVPGPKPDGQVAAIIDVILGTSARIGEALAIRRCDVDLDGAVPTVHLCGTIAHPQGGGAYRKPRPKTAKSNRVLAIPSFTVQAIKERLAAIPEGPEELIFQTRYGTPMRAHNTRRLLRQITDETSIEGLRPHKLRRTAGTAVGREAGVELASNLLGHSTLDMTRTNYIAPETIVDPRSAQILERFGQEESRNEKDTADLDASA